MQKRQRHTYDVFLKVRDFGEANRPLLPESSKAGQLLGVVGEVIAEIERKGSARLDAKREGHHTAEARTALKRWMLDLARFSRDIARTSTMTMVPLKMPVRGNDKALLDAAHSFLEAGKTYSDELVQRGLGEQWAETFTKAIDTFAACRLERFSGKRSGLVASSSIDTAIKRGLDALQTLDGIIELVLRKEPVLRPSWEQCRRIPRPGRSRKGSAPAEVLVHSGEGELEKAS